MSWLKKFGQTALKITAVAAGLQPMITPLLPQKTQAVVNDTFSKIIAAVAATEAIATAMDKPNTTGADKLRGAVPLVSQIIHASELVAGRKVRDEAAFSKAIETITSGTADLLNALE